jgi:hypothetical protein
VRSTATTPANARPLEDRLRRPVAFGLTAEPPVVACRAKPDKLLGAVSSEALGERNGFRGSAQAEALRDRTQLTKTTEIFGDEREPFNVRTLRALLA